MENSKQQTMSASAASKANKDSLVSHAWQQYYRTHGHSCLNSLQRSAIMANLHFPDEIWVEIFSYMNYDTLKKMHLVSKRFCNILAAPQFNKTLFRPDKDDPEFDSGTFKALHPFVANFGEYIGMSESLWLAWHCYRSTDQLYVKSRREIRCSLLIGKQWQFSTTSIADDSVHWPPWSREKFPKFLDHTNPDCKFITVSQWITYHHMPKVCNERTCLHKLSKSQLHSAQLEGTSTSST